MSLGGHQMVQQPPHHIAAAAAAAAAAAQHHHHHHQQQQQHQQQAQQQRAVGLTTYYRTLSVDNKPQTVIIGPSKQCNRSLTTTPNCRRRRRFD